MTEEEEFEFRNRLEQEQAQATSAPTPETPQPSFMDTVGAATRNILTTPAKAVADVATNPVTMARVLPAAMGTAGAVSPVPGGATMGTVAGRQMSNVALKALGHPEYIPSAGEQMLEGGLALAGDVAAIPAIKKGIFGAQIGKAETAANVITRAADKYPTSGNVGEVLNTLEGQLASGTITDPSTAKTAKDVVDFIYRNPNIVGKSNAIKIQAQRVSELATENLNRLVPGRAAAAGAYRTAMTIPRNILEAYAAIPPWGKRGLQFGVAAAGGKGLYEGIASLIGGNR